ncbi:MAG: spermidine/putrescine transport system substrate-binding protein [Thermoleophilaceae bacterium]|jgi:spermidine/putrescine transport system substrate-binding protein|nr:spermidine/putrescine transport system substrate-binding protein [Thermoleophilaceae bacterium]
MIDPGWNRNITRKGFVFAGAASAFIAACGGSSDTSSKDDGSSNKPKKAAELTGVLHYYNWADYVNPETYTAFTAATGVKIKKDFFVSNEELQAKLQGGARGFDLAAPTGYMVQILADAGLLEELDWSQLATVEKNLDPQFRKLPYDPDDKWSVPKDWGTTGFMYRSDLVKEKPTTWREFVDLAKGPYSGKVTVLDGIPECVGSMLCMLGYSYNSEDEAEIDQAKKELIDLKPHLLAITSTEYKQMLIDGKAVMALGWNGDGAAVAAKKPADYVIAEEGGEFWVDAYVIPKGAENPTAAHAWIDYVYDPTANSLETEFTYYGSPVKRDLLEPVMDKKVFTNEDVFPPEATLENLEPNSVSPDGTKLRDRAWTEFKAA